MTALSAGFYSETTGARRRIWVTNDRVRVYDSTHTSNPHQPSHKWFQMARPKNIDAYVERKLADGTWQREEHI